MNRLQRGLLLAAGLVAAAVVVPLGVLVRDRSAPLRGLDDVDPLGPGPLRDLCAVLTHLGDPLPLEVAALVLAVLLRRRLAPYVLLSVWGALAVSTGLKLVVDRVRPCDDLASCPATTSFPSGHAVGAAAFWTTAAVLLLPVLGRRAWGLLVVPVVVAATRVLLGYHYVSDVLAGLVVGGCWAAACTAVFAAWKDQRAGRDVPLEEGVG